MSTITMSAKFPGKCAACGFRFAQGTQILFDTEKRTAEHSKCPEQSYDGAEQAAVFDLWIARAQEVEHPMDRADRLHEEEISAPPSPHLSQPDEDMEAGK